MDSYIIYPNALTCLGHGEDLWNNLLNGHCGLIAAKDSFPEWFPDSTSKIGTIRGLRGQDSRLFELLELMGESIIPEEANRCQLILGASSLGDLEGPFTGDPLGCIKSYLECYRPELAPLFKGVISSACSSGTDVLSMASILVDRGKYDIVGILAADCLDRGKLLQHFALGTQGPDRAKPFDLHRSGTSFGEGAAFAIVANSRGLERLSLRPSSRVLGFGMSCDAMHITAPDDSGEIPSQAIAKALKAANASPSDIAYVNAHASGTPINDRVETTAMRKVFGPALNDIVVSGTKGAVGHLLGATGLVEAVVTCWTLSRGIAPGTVGLTEIDDGLELNVASENEPTVISGPIGVSTTFGFGGVNSCVVLTSSVN